MARMMLWAALSTVLLLAACADQPPTPEPATEIARPPASATSAPSATVPPTAVPPTATATATATAAATATLTPTLMPSPTLLPTPTVTATSATLTSTVASPPGGLLDQALRAQRNGDYAQAVTLLLPLLDDDLAADEAREVSYRLAENYWLAGDATNAARAWTAFLAAYPEDERVPDATLMLARAYHQNEDCAQAIPHYQAYLAREMVLADMVYEWVGDCYAATDNPAAQAQAMGSYRQAIKATQNRSTEVALREKIAGLYLAQSDYASAVTEYDAILAVAKIEDYRAKIEYLAGQALAAAGQTDAAHERFARAVNSYPKAEHAYASLIELVNAGVPVDELQRGRVDYYAGKAHPDAYGAAISAFERYIAAPQAPKADEALYLKALSERGSEQPDAALRTLEKLLADHPQSGYADNARLELGATYAWKGDNRQAVKAYQDVAAYFPASELAPEALMRAARLLEGDRNFGEAAAAFEDLQARFPGYENADEALWRAGLAQYRAGSTSQATAQWQALLTKYPKSVYRPKTLFWLGKLEAQPDTGPGYWEQVAQAGPSTYYALRIDQIKKRDPLTSGRMILEPVTPPAWDRAQVAAEIKDWLRGWAALPAGADVATLPLTVTQRTDFKRAEALLAIGLRREALAAYDTVRSAAWSDAASLAPLALYWHEEGMYGLASRAATRLAGLWPKGEIPQAPDVLQHLSYPLPYVDLLIAESQSHSLDPLLLAALIRQESLFEPAAESYAGARGLGQVMPSTGEGIARNLSMADFVLDDLYRPWVSVRFAAYYLALQLNRFDDQILVALAAYNGGPGNTLRWLDASELAGGDDLDLFVEVITASQSRIYLQRVYEQYVTYERLYRTSGTEQP